MFASSVDAHEISIWLEGTSEKHAILSHLLACLLDKIWDAPEAIFEWIYLIIRRKKKRSILKMSTLALPP
jgi:hypothetical protein